MSSVEETRKSSSIIGIHQDPMFSYLSQGIQEPSLPNKSSTWSLPVLDKRLVLRCSDNSTLAMLKANQKLLEINKIDLKNVTVDDNEDALEIEEGQSGEDSSSVEGCSRCQVYHCIVH